MDTTFTPLASLAGGALIGLAAVCLMLLRGRIMGATGILAGAMWPASMYDWTWRAAMLVGMVTGPWIYFALTGGLPAIEVPSATPLLIFGGVLVGVGGMARLSPRSFAATATFMLTTGLTVYVIRHVLGG
jgi:hypothetical protein